jgi:hypothetical protein
MKLEAFRTLARAVTSTRSVLSLHPLKLARWHQELFELPEVLFLQQGCGAMFEQLSSATSSIVKMSAVLGPELKYSYRELATRQVGSWPLLVRSSSEARPFLVRWDSRESKWTLGAADDPTNLRTVESLEDGVAGAVKWAGELDEKARQDEAELRETLGEAESAPSVEPL